MQIEKMRLFARLLEDYLREDSSAMDQRLLTEKSKAEARIGSVPGGREVVQYLHRELGLAHNQRYKSTDKISWSTVKDTRWGSWILIRGSKAAAAIKAQQRGNGYISVAFDPATGQVERYENARAGNIIDFIKNKIGALRAFYLGTDTGQVKKTQDKRQELGQKPSMSEVSPETLITRFRPLWLRTMTTAEADIRGMIATMIKNGAYNKAKKKMDQAMSLQSGIERLETGMLGDFPDFIRRAVSLAVAMAAAYHYPQETGEIRRDDRNYYNTYTAQFDEGPRKLLKDISNGDTNKLATILAFFKRSLVSG